MSFISDGSMQIYLVVKLSLCALVVMAVVVVVVVGGLVRGDGESVVSNREPQILLVVIGSCVRAGQT